MNNEQLKKDVVFSSYAPGGHNPGSCILVKSLKVKFVDERSGGYVDTQYAVAGYKRSELFEMAKKYEKDSKVRLPERTGRRMIDSYFVAEDV